MTFINEELEKCENCGDIVDVEEQYNGFCHPCIKKLGLSSCSACGDLVTQSTMDDVYRCAKCQKKRSSLTS